jgi:hypothetical protein
MHDHILAGFEFAIERLDHLRKAGFRTGYTPVRNRKRPELEAVSCYFRSFSGQTEFSLFFGRQQREYSADAGALPVGLPHR